MWNVPCTENNPRCASANFCYVILNSLTRCSYENLLQNISHVTIAADWWVCCLLIVEHGACLWYFQENKQKTNKDKNMRHSTVSLTIFSWANRSFKFSLGWSFYIFDWRLYLPMVFNFLWKKLWIRTLQIRNMAELNTSSIKRYNWSSSSIKSFIYRCWVSYHECLCYDIQMN